MFVPEGVGGVDDGVSLVVLWRLVQHGHTVWVAAAASAPIQKAIGLDHCKGGVIIMLLQIQLQLHLQL